MQTWNPWHGCTKISPGCEHCYMYRRDAEFGKDSSVVTKTSSFDLPRKKDRHGEYKLKVDGEAVFTCGTSDFFHPDSDGWRGEAWKMIRERSDLHFFIITKRIHRFSFALPEDWGEGYENVTIGCTCENQNRADYRLPIFLAAPIRHRVIIHEPMLEEIHIEHFLNAGKIEQVVCGGESGEDARVCDFAWILSMMNQCVAASVNFHFKQTGAKFRKGDKVYLIERSEQIKQAKKANVDFSNN